MIDHVAFECSSTQRGGEIEITYSIKNGRGDALGVFNKISAVAIDGGLDFSPNHVYREITQGVLHLMKRALPLPPGLQVTGPLAPHASRVAPGETLTETFVVRLPVEVRQRFKFLTMRGEVRPCKPMVAREIELSIGVFPCTEEVRAVAEHPAFPEVLTLFKPAAAIAAQTVLSRRIPLRAAIAVLDYEAFPWS